MSGFFGVASKKDCVMHLFFGVDYHSHLGTRRGGLAVYGEDGFIRRIHNIENSPFRTKFEKDVDELKGNIGIGCISDNEAQPLLINSHLGSYAITTVGRINNIDELREDCFKNGKAQFLEMNKGLINPTELVASLINQKDNIVDGIINAQEKIHGSMSILIMFEDKIYCARDKFGRTPVIIGKAKNGYCVSFESSAYINLGYKYVCDLGPGEIVYITNEELVKLKEPRTNMKICSFLWTYYGYPTATYEGVNVETMRYRCGQLLRKRDNVEVDAVAGVPDSGVAHAIGYANESGYPYTRPFIKYTPTWPRSFMPTSQAQRNLIAKMKLIPVQELIKDKKLLLIDDSIVRGTQLKETVDFLYDAGVKEVHVRPACPPIMCGCKFLNFSRSTSNMDLITRRVICELEGTNDVTDEVLNQYIDPEHEKHEQMVQEICKKMNFTSLKYHRLDDLIKAIGIGEENLCTYCFNGKE
ncbi:MAG: amidophosphoribosyltransferase [Bacilli bacterium]|nr:amidophosphoribosyltransferase [Bacilli bacterium]